jgi:hypothetical protein
MLRRLITIVLLLGAIPASARAQDLNAMRDDQINRLKNYVVDAILPSGLVRDSLVLNGASFHPATPDAAGFALLGLSALDHLEKLPDAETRVENILKAHAGQKPGVTPARSVDGHFIHFMNVNTGAPAGGGWNASYSPISTALLVAGAQFARNHFRDNATIAALAEQLTDSVNFNAAIHPSLDGRIYLNMTAAGGGGSSGAVRPWNEFMLVESLALRETNNNRALAVEHLWLDTDNIPKRSYAGIPTLTDNPSAFAPAFWVHQMHFFNGDFRHSADFETFFENHRVVDQLFSSNAPPFGLGEEYRYGITAGVSPQGYNADSISNHPNNVLSPEAVAAWGDMDTLLQWYPDQFPTSDSRFKYGMVRESQTQPSWVPFDAGLVDHLFLLFGLVESIDADFFKDRVFGFTPGDYNRDGAVDALDFDRWRANLGSETVAGPDGNQNGIVDAADYVLWRKLDAAAGSGAAVPEPVAPSLALIGLLLSAFYRVKRPQTRKKFLTNRKRTESACSSSNPGVICAVG